MGPSVRFHKTMASAYWPAARNRAHSRTISCHCTSRIADRTRSSTTTTTNVTSSNGSARRPMADGADMLATPPRLVK